MPGTDYDSATNVHICRNGVPGRAGRYVPGVSVAYENQALTYSIQKTFHFPNNPSGIDVIAFEDKCL